MDGEVIQELPDKKGQTEADEGSDLTESAPDTVMQDNEKKQECSTDPPESQEETAGGASTSQPLQDELTAVSEETIAKLSAAFIEAIQPHFEHSKDALLELIRNQELLLETVQQENRKYEENQMLEDVNVTMKTARLYQAKLVNIRKEMAHLHDKVGKLKKRALKLQSQRMKENLQREQQKEREYEEDRLLRARPASSQSPEGTTGSPA